MTLRRNFGWLLLVLLLFSLTGGRATAAPAEAAVENPVGACEQFGRELKQRFPSFCQQRVHWVVAVDIGGSLLGKLEKHKDFLELWLRFIVLPGDEITLVPYHYALLEPRHWTVPADRKAFSAIFLAPLERNDEKRGSAVNDARRRVLEIGRDLPTAVQPITLVLSDRDDNDQLQANRQKTEELWTAFRGQFATSEVQPTEGTVEAHLGYRIGPKDVPLHAFVSGRKGQGTGTPAASSGSRVVPLARPVTEYPDAEPDTKLGLRVALWGVLLVLALALVIAAIRLWGAPAGKLRKTDNFAVTVPWRPFRRTPRTIHASHSLEQFALEPVRPGMNDPAILRYELENPWSWKPWQIRMHVVEPYQARLETAMELQDWSDQLMLNPGGSQELTVRDQKGLVAGGRLEFSQDPGTRRLYQGLVIGLGVLFLALVVVPFVYPSLQPAPPAAPITRDVDRLC